MDYESSCNTRWQEISENGETNESKSRVEMDMDLSLTDLFPQPVDEENIAPALTENREGIRQQVFRIAAEEILPKIIQDSGTPQMTDYEGVFRTEAKTSIDCAFDPVVEEERASLRNQMNIAVFLSSNLPASPLQSLHNARGGVASAIADNVIHNLEQTYLEKQSSQGESSYKFSGDKVTDYRAEPKEQSKS